MTTPRWSFLITIGCDVVLPVALYYALRAMGTTEITALLVSGAAPALHAVHTWIRHHKLDAIGVFTLSLLALSTLAALLTADPRVALARNAVFTAAAGVWLLVTLLLARPFTYQATKTLLPGRAQLLESLWKEDAAFRRVWRGLTVLWAAGLLLDALARVIMAYTLPVDAVPAIDTVLYVVSWVLLQVVTQITLFRTGTMAKMQPDVPAR